MYTKKHLKWRDSSDKGQPGNNLKIYICISKFYNSNGSIFEKHLDWLVRKTDTQRSASIEFVVFHTKSIISAFLVYAYFQTLNSYWRV